MSIFNIPVRFDHNAQASFLCTIAENLIEIGDKGFNVIAINSRTGQDVQC